MEVLSGILLGLVAMVLLAAVGITTLAAFAIMAVLGIVTEISFKRLFFISFGLGLLAPILVAGAIGATIDSNEFQRDFANEMGDVLPQMDGLPGNLGEAVPRIRDLRDQLRAGEITPEEFERELETLIEETSGTRIDLETGDRVEGENTLRIESN